MFHKNLLPGSILGGGASMVLDGYFRKVRSNREELLCLIMSGYSRKIATKNTSWRQNDYMAWGRLAASRCSVFPRMAHRRRLLRVELYLENGPVNARRSAGSVENKESSRVRKSTMGQWHDGKFGTVKSHVWQQTDLGSNPSSAPF